ncbi:MAG: YebC/PmpR family DNA-binding transcriptional regulator [Candidatus Omnitrophica bacterium]|nr:YebC/PmpR family DNA-binding transcriptional regulator [Candidatus Omnitrophota bacterium]
MSGHSKWASIKHKKAATDAKRGKIFTKIIKEITIAARMGGGSSESNPRLRLAISNAKNSNMPADNIDRAIKKGTGELPGVSYEEIYYEGYGPGGVAMYVKCLTDNKNRASAEIRNVFSKNNGNMAGAGSVAWMFEAKGLIVVRSDQADEEKLFELVIDAGAEDMSMQGDSFEIITDPSNFENVKNAIAGAEIPIASDELTMLPKSTTKVEGNQARGVLSLVEALEDHDDVQNVYSNFDIPDDVLNEG